MVVQIGINALVLILVVLVNKTNKQTKIKQTNQNPYHAHAILQSSPFTFLLRVRESWRDWFREITEVIESTVL